MTDPRGPIDPITDLHGYAAMLHELYVSLVAAGFEPKQALYLVGCQLHPPNGPE